MTSKMIHWTIAAIVWSSFQPAAGRAEQAGEYELTVAVAKKALAGWELYQAKKFAASFDGGSYTDPDETTRSRDFWSNGRYARLDRDNNGHHETVFLIEQGELIYVGSLGMQGAFVDVASAHAKYRGKPVAALAADLK